MNPAATAQGADERAVCPRLGRSRTVEEHLACPYCYGKPADVATGPRSAYCGFEPGVDPICFGFPESCGRLRDG